MIFWVLTATLANPPQTVEPQAVVVTTWTTEKDCKQAADLQLRIAKLEKNEKRIKCRAAERVDPVFDTKMKDLNERLQRP